MCDLNGLSSFDRAKYDRNSQTSIGGLSDGTEYYVIKVDANTFKLATTSTNAGNGTALTITGGQGGSTSDKFSSPRTGLLDGQTYYVVKTDDHNFKIAESYTLATNSTPSVITIAPATLSGGISATIALNGSKTIVPFLP